jgi:hypothetical protein
MLQSKVYVPVAITGVSIANTQTTVGKTSRRNQSKANGHTSSENRYNLQSKTRSRAGGCIIQKIVNREYTIIGPVSGCNVIHMIAGYSYPPRGVHLGK